MSLKAIYLSRFFTFVFIFLLVVIEYMAIISVEFELVKSSWDKINHFLAFIVLYITMNFGLKSLNLIQKIVILMIYAVQIEVVQVFLPNRYFSLLDILADFIGVLFGILAVRVLLKFTAR